MQLNPVGTLIDDSVVDHLNIQNIGANSHAQIDTHIADATLHFTEGSIDHTAIGNIGTNTHPAIDVHIANANIHFSDAPADAQDYVRNNNAWAVASPGGVTDHTLLSNIGTNTHVQIDAHISDATIHFTEASISHTAITNIGTNSHVAIDSHIADGTLHFTEASIDHIAIANTGVNTHPAIDIHIANVAIHFADAPADAQDYVRNNNAWAVASFSATLSGLTDVDLTGQVQGDLLFNVDGTNWEDTGGNILWDGTDLTIIGDINIQAGNQILLQDSAAVWDTYTFANAAGHIETRGQSGNANMTGWYLFDIGDFGVFDISGNAPSTPPVAADTPTATLSFWNTASQPLGTLGFSGYSEMLMFNNHYGGDIRIYGYDAVGGYNYGLRSRGSGETELGHLSSWNARTLTAASGGFAANNTLTGAGFERVLTTSDLPTVITDHTLLSNIGANTHAQIDTHIADGTIHLNEAAIDATHLRLDTANDPLTGELATQDIVPDSSAVRDVGLAANRYRRMFGRLGIFVNSLGTPNIAFPSNANHGGIISGTQNGPGIVTHRLNGGGFAAAACIGVAAANNVSGTSTIEATRGGATVIGASYAYGTGTAQLRASGYASTAIGYAYGAGTSTLEATNSGSLAFGYAHARQTAGTALISSRGNGSFATGNARAFSGGASSATIESTAAGSFTAGYVRVTSAVLGRIAAIAAGSFAQGSVNTSALAASILASGIGSFAQGAVTSGQVISATATNAVQFGVGTNALADSLQVGNAGLRFKGTAGAPGTPQNGDMWVNAGFVYVRSNGASIQIAGPGPLTN